MKISSGEATAKKIERVFVYFATSTGTSEKFAQNFLTELKAVGVEANLASVADVEAEEQLPAMTAASKSLLVIITSTFTDGNPPEAGKWFYGWLSDSAKDFRFDLGFESHLSAPTGV